MFCELVCGPPGSGKTTYCEGKRQFLSVYDPSRPVVLVNFDPGNDGIFPYPCDVDVRDFASLRVVAQEEHLGPNGSYLFCADVIMEHIDEVVEAISSMSLQKEHALAPGAAKPPYVIVDCPGQVEFYTQCDVLHHLERKLMKKLRCSICCVHLTDSVIATRDGESFVATCLLAFTTMGQYQLPHVNVLSKWDAVELNDEQRDIFLDVGSFFTDHFNRMWTKSKGSKLYRLTEAIMDVVDGYGMVDFVPLAIEDRDMMLQLTQLIDHAMGYFS